MIAWRDMLSLGYRSGEMDPRTGCLDCRGVVHEIYHRAGAPLPPWATTLDVPDGFWDEVEEDSIQELDVIASDPELEGVASHLSVVVRGGITGTALSSARGLGVYSVSILRIRNPIGVYRVNDLGLVHS